MYVSSLYTVVHIGYCQHMLTPNEMPPLLERFAALTAPLVDIMSHERGVYFLWAADGNLLYVGQSGDVATRVVQHWCAGIRYGRATWQHLPQRLLTMYERQYIYELDPPLNRQHRRFIP